VPSLKPIAPAWGWRQLEPEGPTTDINRDVGVNSAASTWWGSITFGPVV